MIVHGDISLNDDNENDGNQKGTGIIRSYRKPQNRVIFAVDFLSIPRIVQCPKHLHSGSTKYSSPERNGYFV
jgi:hypothetical protein